SDGARPPTGAGDADGSGAGHSTQMRSRLLMVALLAAVTLAGTVRFEQARQRLGASRLVAVAEGSILQMAQGGAVPPPLLRRNLELLRRAAEMDPADVGVPIAEGGHFFLLKRHSAAIRAYERAAELEMRSEIFANLARVYLQSGDRDKAIEAIETAITLDNTQRKTFGDTLREEKRRRRQEMNR
ncbi:MAG: tetratricopeptide repeat protein, partial [Acidobacteriota bacterium]